MESFIWQNQRDTLADSPEHCVCVIIIQYVTDIFSYIRTEVDFHEVPFVVSLTATNNTQIARLFHIFLPPLSATNLSHSVDFFLCVYRR